jgi:CheY-like chemotaxis protein
MNNDNNRSDRRMWRSALDTPTAPAAGIVADIVHDLRSPLGGIDAMARLLMDTALTDAQRRIVEGLAAASTHLRHVASDLLDGGARQRFALELRPVSIDLPALLADIAISAEARAAVKGLDFNCACDAAVPQSVTLDPVRLRQMIENLLDNAMRATDSGSVRLDVGFDEASRQLRFTVSDTGPGLHPRAVEALVSRPQHQPSQVAGAGLGLSIVHRLAARMGGQTGVDSEPGQGTSVWFTISVGGFQTVITACSNSVLVVDDNAANRQIMQVMLGHFGRTCVLAETGEQALEMLKERRFSAVMLDQSLPGISGLDVLKVIRSGACLDPAVPVIAVTGHVGRKDRAAFEAAGATGFIAKPYSARDVGDALAAIGETASADQG